MIKRLGLVRAIGLTLTWLLLLALRLPIYAAPGGLPAPAAHADSSAKWENLRSKHERARSLVYPSVCLLDQDSKRLMQMPAGTGTFPTVPEPLEILQLVQSFGPETGKTLVPMQDHPNSVRA